MWQSRTFGKLKKNVNDNNSEKDNNQSQDSGRIDSGFLSGSDLQEICESTSSPTITVDNVNDQGIGFLQGDNKKPVGGCFSPSKVVIPEPMRTDSGVDLGLSESLSQLTLKPVNLNQLPTDKVQTEPTFELIPVTDHAKNQTQQESCDKKIQIDKLTQQGSWQFYYTQDDDGDTLVIPSQ